MLISRFSFTFGILNLFTELSLFLQNSYVNRTSQINIFWVPFEIQFTYFSFLRHITLPNQL